MNKYKTLLGLQNAKTTKGESLGYLTGILYMTPSTLSGKGNTCPMASKGCKEACLFTAGRGKFNNVKQARLNKTELFYDNFDFFKASLLWDIKRTINKANKTGLIPCIRLNGTSDIVWEDIIISDNKNIFELFPSVQFYDYTPNYKRIKALTGYWQNYHLTFSRKESRANHVQCEKMLAMGVNVACVYLDAEKALKNIPDTIDGDSHDLRFLDGKHQRGKIVVLKAKGDAKKDLSGFVIRN
jgi:hypothetical protein